VTSRVIGYLPVILDAAGLTHHMLQDLAPGPFLSFAHSIPLVILGAVVWGAAMGAHESTLRAAVADLVPAHRRGGGYGTFTAIYGLAWLTGASIIGVSLDKIATLNQFSADPQYCAGKIPVASDADGKIAKSYDLHVTAALRTTLAENLAMISGTSRHLSTQSQRLFLYTEHFFSGYLSDPAYALHMVQVSPKSSSEVVAQFDTTAVLPFYAYLAATSAFLENHCAGFGTNSTPNHLLLVGGQSPTLRNPPRAQPSPLWDMPSVMGLAADKRVVAPINLPVDQIESDPLPNSGPNHHVFWT